MNKIFLSLAQEPPAQDTEGGIGNPVLGPNLRDLSGVSFFQQLLPTLVTLGFIAGAVLFLFMLIAGSIQWITSGGDKASLESARGRITHALIGIVVLFSIFAIITLIEAVFKINILILDIGSLKL